MNAGSGLRFGRAAMFALVCAVLAVASRRRRGPVGVTALTVGAQAVLHLWLLFCQGTMDPGPGCS